jgi:hypothetical protein
MRIGYEEWTPGDAALDVIEQADRICADYRGQGYDLTLRQLYYQFVARGLISNDQRSYKRLGDIVNKARLAGYLDWNYIVDRTRNLQSVSHWETPADIIDSAARSFRIDKWDDQPTRVEVWVEKEALAGVIGQVAARHDCAWFSCRGYVSQSELWRAAMRLREYNKRDQEVVVLHLGDHDPSGIDMTRDIEDRLALFGAEVDVRRIALNMDQVERYNPPPNPAKLTDSRAGGYIHHYGRQSWELDALDPAKLDALIEAHVLEVQDAEQFAAAEEVEAGHRDMLDAAADRWDEVVDMLKEDDDR